MYMHIFLYIDNRHSWGYAADMCICIYTHDYLYGYTYVCSPISVTDHILSQLENTVLVNTHIPSQLENTVLFNTHILSQLENTVLVNTHS